MCIDLQALRIRGFIGEFYTLAKGFGPILRGLGQAFKKGRLVATSISPSVKAVRKLHALSPLQQVDAPLIGINIHRFLHQSLVLNIRIAVPSTIDTSKLMKRVLGRVVGSAGLRIWNGTDSWPMPSNTLYSVCGNPTSIVPAWNILRI